MNCEDSRSIHLCNNDHSIVSRGGYTFPPTRCLWHRHELSACAMTMCCGSPYHLILFPVAIWSVDSGEQFCLHLAITGAQTFSTNLALKVGHPYLTQLRSIGVKYIIRAVYSNSFYVKTHSENCWSVQSRCRPAGLLPLHRNQDTEGVPSLSLQSMTAGRTQTHCVTKPRSQEELSGPTT